MSTPSSKTTANLFTNLSNEERWALRAEGGIADQTYRQPDSNDTIGRSQKRFSQQHGRRASRNQDASNDPQKHTFAVPTSGRSYPPSYQEYIGYQTDVKDRTSRFVGKEDYMRHLELGTEFDEATKYSSKSKSNDTLGFEYSVPPKHLTLNARWNVQYAKWVSEEQQLEDEEATATSLMYGDTSPLTLEDLHYEVPQKADISFDTYYRNIKDLSSAERKYEIEMFNVADSALIVDGNVAYGKTVTDEMGNFEFERKVSVESLGHVDSTYVSTGHRTVRKMEQLAKMVRGKMSKDDNDEKDSSAVKTSNSNLLLPPSATAKSGGSLRGLKQRLKGHGGSLTVSGRKGR